jgi:hypothetical protein
MRLGLGDEPVVEQTRVPRAPSSSPRLAPASGHPAPLLYALLILPLFGILVWAGLTFHNTRVEAEIAGTERPVFSQLRPLRLDDLDPTLRDRMASRYPAPVSVRLMKHRGNFFLRIYSRNRVVRERKVVYGDLNADGILQRYYDRTGDRADSIELKYRRGTPYVYIYSSSDLEVF